MSAPVATVEDWAVRYQEGDRTQWVQDPYGFPLLHSEAKARSLCIDSRYTARKLRVVAYDITEEGSK